MAKKETMKRDPMDVLEAHPSLSSREIDTRCHFLKPESEPPPPRLTPPETFLCDGLVDERSPLYVRIRELLNNKFPTFEDSIRQHQEGFSLDVGKSSVMDSPNNGRVRPPDATRHEKTQNTDHEIFHKKTSPPYAYPMACAVISLPVFHTTEKEKRLYNITKTLAVSHEIHDIQWYRLSENSALILLTEHWVTCKLFLQALCKMMGENGVESPHAGADFLIECPDGAHLKKMIDHAIIAYDHAAFFGPGAVTLFDDVSLNIFGDRLYRYGEIKKAADAYREGLDRNPENTNLLNSLGVCHSVMNQLDTARNLFERAIRLSPSDDVVLYNTGLTYHLLNNPKTAIHYLQQALLHNEALYDAQLTLGIVFINAQRQNEAWPHLERAIALNPRSGLPHRILGDLLLERKALEQAIKSFTQAIHCNPDDAYALSGLAQSYEIKNSNLDIAADLAHQSLLIQPDNPHFRVRLAKIYMKQGKFNDADIEFSKAEKTLAKKTKSRKAADTKWSSKEPVSVYKNDDVKMPLDKGICKKKGKKPLAEPSTSNDASIAEKKRSA